MQVSANKNFLPSIQRKTKPMWTPRNGSSFKKSTDSIFMSQSKGFEKGLEFSSPLKLDKLIIAKSAVKENNEKGLSYVFANNKKGSYANIAVTQSIANIKTGAGAGAGETSSRQSRYEGFVKQQLKNFKDSSPRETSLSTSLSPERKIKPSGAQSYRAKSEFAKGKALLTSPSSQAFDLIDLKVIDSMELDHIEETQCEVDGELGIQMPTLKSGRKRKGYTALSEMVPLNLELEKINFFDKQFKHNPQFEYVNQNFKQHFDKPHTKYLKISKMILNACMKDYKDDEQFLEATGGRLITKEETETYFNNYIKELGLEGYLDIIFSENTVAPTSVIHDPNGKSRVVISLPITYREQRITGVMHHEIGTHFIRKFNDRQQGWFKNRKKYDLKPYLIIEEGLAALNQTLEHAMDMSQQPYLWNAALHYYSCYMSSILGFEALFKDLEQYIKDPMKRWKQCVRVKRGMTDTSQPGGMYKDQVYLRGAIEILKKRKKIDFVLLHSGKINVKDLQRLIKNGSIKTENLKLASFLKNLDEYKTAMDRIAAANFIDALK